MQLTSFHVAGFRSLVRTESIPVAKPTVLTGNNDGGKTSCLDALDFLLDSGRVTETDYARLVVRSGEEAAGEPGGEVEHDVSRADEVVVTGRFLLGDADREALELAVDELDVRRVQRADGTPAYYEMRVDAPQDERLRSLESRKIGELKQLAGELEIEAVGKKSAAVSWLDPLRAAADAEPQVNVWVVAPSALRQRLPRYVRFSATREPNLKQEIHAALRGLYKGHLNDDSIMEPIRQAESRLQDLVRAGAQELCDHIKTRCPELDELRVDPIVSFSEGFTRVDVSTGSGGVQDIPVEQAGAGSRRRMTLAVWEWTRDLLASSAEQDVVLAYDEPDTHLDYARQRELVELIREQSRHDHVRVVVATHSLNLIDKVDVGNVVQLVKGEDDATIVRRLLTDDHEEVDRHLAAISTSMGLRNSVLLHERMFLAVEGATEEQALPLLFRTATGISLQSAGIALVSGKNNRGALEVTKWLTQHGRRIEFLIDADSADQTSTRRLFTPTNLQAAGVLPEQMHLVGDPSEIEELFRDQQWAEAANELWPRVDESAWTSAHFADLRTAGKFSDKVVDMLRTASLQGPTGKPDCLVAFATRLREPEEVPAALREVFSKLLEDAA